MSLFTRTALLQARVCPEIKYASEDVLRRIGLNLTEAMELFLRRVIIDQKLPFDVVAMDSAIFENVMSAQERRGHPGPPKHRGRSKSQHRGTSPPA